MKRDGGEYRCVLCGTVLEIPKGKVPRTGMASDGSVEVRVVTVDGSEIHRCTYDPRPGRGKQP